MFDSLTDTERRALREAMLRACVASSRLARYCLDASELWHRAYDSVIETAELHRELLTY